MGDVRVIRKHALSVRVGRAIEHLDGDGGLSMRVVPRIREIIRPGIQRMYSGAFFAHKHEKKAPESTD